MRFDKKYYSSINKLKKANKYDRCKCGKYNLNTGNIKEKCPSSELDYFLEGCGIIHWDSSKSADSKKWVV